MPKRKFGEFALFVAALCSMPACFFAILRATIELIRGRVEVAAVINDHQQLITKPAIRHSRAVGNPRRDGQRNSLDCAGMTLRERVHKQNVGRTVSLAQIVKLRGFGNSVTSVVKTAVVLLESPENGFLFTVLQFSERCGRKKK
jgi:hypothetical protein